MKQQETVIDGPQKHTKEQPDYLSYLLRLWRASEEETAWRASLESSHTGEREGFASLDDLFGFLREQTGMRSDANKNGDESRVLAESGGQQ